MPALIAPENKNAEDVKAGEIFTFRGTQYICLNGFTDQRTTQTILTCIDGRSLNTVKGVTVLRLLRTFKIMVTATCPIELKVLHHTREEITPDMESECEQLIRNFLKRTSGGAELPTPVFDNRGESHNSGGS